MSEKAAKMAVESTAPLGMSGFSDPLVEFMVYLKIILPEGAVHTVSLRPHHDPEKRASTWVLSPGSFHVRHGDLIYWSVSDSSAEMKFEDDSIIGKESLSLPYNGTKMGTIQSDAPSGSQKYVVTVAEGTVETDDGSDPTIIIDD
jgi:hypothetical protein